MKISVSRWILWNARFSSLWSFKNTWLTCFFPLQKQKTTSLAVFSPFFLFSIGIILNNTFFFKGKESGISTFPQVFDRGAPPIIRCCHQLTIFCQNSKSLSCWHLLYKIACVPTRLHSQNSIKLARGIWFLMSWANFSVHEEGLALFSTFSVD